MKKILWGAFLASAFVLVPLSGQDSEKSIEESYLNSNALKKILIRTKARSPDRDMKIVALNDIENIVESNSEVDSDIFEILRNLANEGVTYIVRERNHIENDFPVVRRESVRVLGQINTEQSAETLITVLLNDREPMVTSEAILALSQIDVKNKVLRDKAMAQAMLRQSVLTKDVNFAKVFLDSVENMINRDGGIGDPVILGEVIKLANGREGGFPSVIRRTAIDLLQKMQDL